MDRNSRIFIAGHRGLVGSALHRRMAAEGYSNLLLQARDQLELTDQAAVHRFFAQQRPEYVFLVAGKVGGIRANDSYPADFIYQNLVLATNVIHAAAQSGVRKLLFTGSSCIYPRLASQPIHEESLLAGPLEPTNQWYAIAKIAAIKLAQAYRRQHGFRAISAMPTNLYGPGDNFDFETSHVLPALLRKFHEAHLSGAPSVSVWGTGTPRREFLHVDDLAEALIFLMLHYDQEEIINVGTGEDLTVRELCDIIRQVVGYAGELVFDSSKPDGTPRKLLDVSRLRQLGWRPRIGLREGIAQTYSWYVQHGVAPHRHAATHNS